MSPTVRDILWAMAPGLILGTIFASLFLWFALGFAGESPRDNDKEPSLFMPKVFLDFYFWVIDPVVSFVERKQISPDSITIFSLITAAAAGVAIGTGRLMLAFWIMMLTALCDVLDGLIARRTGTSSPRGAFFDSFADRISEALIFAGFAYLGGGNILTWVSYWAMVASYSVSYARARGEGLGVDCKTGLMQRPERITVLLILLYFSPILSLITQPEDPDPFPTLAFVAVSIVAIFATQTAFVRAKSVMQKLDRGSDTKGGPADQ